MYVIDNTMIIVALESGVRRSLLGDVDQKMKKKDHGQLAKSCCMPGNKN